ncbi:MAG TPA: hypothetical protein DIW34_01220 [Oribacterium sp.]|nr:hypothetical protein [Oribacterium sp.]
MKKRLTYTILVTMAALSLAACGGKKQESGAADAAVEGTIATDGMSDVYATVQKVDGTQLTVELDDGNSMTFDISDAHANPVWTWMPGDEVDIFYEGEGDPTDGMKATEVQMSMPYEDSTGDYNEDPQVYGEITAISDDSVTVREEEGKNEDGGPQDGTEYTFKRASYGIDVGDPQVGTYAQVLYIGDLGTDGATTYRILTDDMMDDDASDVYAVQGTLSKFEDGILYLQCDDGTEFKFTTNDDEQMNADAEAAVGKKVKVSFIDSLRRRVTSADSITVVE